MTDLALRVLAVAIPTRGGQAVAVAAVSPAPDATAAGADPGLFRSLLALPAVYLDAARGLRNDPPWASRRYVPDMAENRARDVAQAERFLGKYGPDRLLTLFPRHAALLGVTPQAEATVTVTVVEPERLALPAGPAATAAATPARPLAEAART